MSTMPTKAAVRPVLGWLWAFLAVVGWLASLLIGLPIAATLGVGLTAGGLRWELGLHVVLAGALSIAITLLIGRYLFGGLVALGWSTFIAPAVGLAIAAAQQIALNSWALARFGVNDSDYIGWTAGLAYLVTLSALGTMGVGVAPRPALVAPLAGSALTSVAIWLVVLSNLPGLRDGIPADSLALASTIGLCALYPLGGLVVGLRRLRAS